MARRRVDLYPILGTLTAYILSLICISSTIVHYQDYTFYTDLMRRIGEPGYKAEMVTLFDHRMNFTEALDWVDEKLEWVPLGVRFTDRRTDPLAIVEGGKGRCGEQAILYVAVYIANGYEARIVRSFGPDAHDWAEVRIGDRWVCVEAVDK